MSKTRTKKGLDPDKCNFGGSIVLFVVLPLLPLLFEAAINKSHIPTLQSSTITAAIYALSIGVSSKNTLVFSMGIAIGIILSCFYGFVSADAINHTLGYLTSFIAIILIAVTHMTERYNKHMVDCEPLFPLVQGERNG
ncbi:hypothetical protein [Escherichia coli]|uniref:hypothetical protein n=1 Tax=Escherichia coli TaxID=562 RepID=UPI001F49D8D9|nr:hypothetical protein [Escherichia coli]